MTETKKPLVFSIEKVEPFTGKALIAFFQAALNQIIGEYLPIAYPIDIVEPFFFSDEQGTEFWTKQLALHVLELRLKEDYNIEIHDYNKYGKSLLFLVIEDIELFELGFTRLLDDLLDPDKKYLLYRMFIKSRMTLTFEERLEAARKKSEQMEKELKERRGY